MKNLLLHINKNKRFNAETETLAKIQIDNSLSLGWDASDIILITNFDYEFMGIKATVIDDSSLYTPHPESTKIPVLLHAMEFDLIDHDTIYWVHDFDAYQAHEITEKELELDGFDIGIVSYGYKDEWNLGSFFFNSSADDILSLVSAEMNKRARTRADEKCLKKLIDNGLIDKGRYKVMNPTYNINMRDVQYNYLRATKPLKVLHFHPYYMDYKLPRPLLDTFMYGKNRMKKVLMPERLISIFYKYGIH